MHLEDNDQSASSEAQTAATWWLRPLCKWLNLAPFQLSKEQNLSKGQSEPKHPVSLTHNGPLRSEGVISAIQMRKHSWQPHSQGTQGPGGATEALHSQQASATHQSANDQEGSTTLLRPFFPHLENGLSNGSQIWQGVNPRRTAL